MVLADELKHSQNQRNLRSNFDPKAPEFISLKEELEQFIQKEKFE
jgi:hypothetical protein